MGNQAREKYKTIEREENPLLKELNAVLGILFTRYKYLFYLIEKCYFV